MEDHTNERICDQDYAKGGGNSEVIIYVSMKWSTTVGITGWLCCVSKTVSLHMEKG